ncbi:MAG: ABC transporter ATP-binding protein [Thermoplasmatota archaeon]
MSLEIQDLHFSYKPKAGKVLEGLSLMVRDGEVYSLLGGSGSGKSTVLNIIAGFLDPSDGRISINGKDVTETRPEKRNIGMVFQDYALFPHMSVRSNVAFGLRTRNVREKDIRRRVGEVLELTGLSGFERKMPSEISGGEKQRVALSRALIYDPEVLLLDEPLSALDASLREGLRKDLRSILKASGTTALYVTHDQMEAISISDRLGLLLNGRIHEEGLPEAMFRRPERLETAKFMGVSNILSVGSFSNGFLKTRIGKISWKGPPPRYIGFRPESLKSKGEGIRIKCKVVSVEYRGRDLLLDLRKGGVELRGIIGGKSSFRPGNEIEMVLDTKDIIPIRDDGG